MAIREISNDSDSEELESNEIKGKEGNFTISERSQDKEWRNIQLIPHSLPIRCRVPHNVLIMMRTIEKQVERKPRCAA